MKMSILLIPTYKTLYISDHRITIIGWDARDEAQILALLRKMGECWRKFIIAKSVVHPTPLHKPLTPKLIFEVMGCNFALSNYELE